MYCEGTDVCMFVYGFGFLLRLLSLSLFCMRGEWLDDSLFLRSVSATEGCEERRGEEGQQIPA